MSDLEARSILGDSVDVYLAGSCPGGSASTVLDVSGEIPTVLREGPIRF